MTTLQLLLILLALLTGAFNTLGFTLQNKQNVREASIDKHFFHPFMQVAMRFISNTLPYLVFLVSRKGKHKEQNQNKQQSHKIVDSDRQQQSINDTIVPSEPEVKINKALFLIPTVLDYASMICYYTALNFIPGSVYQILRGGTVLTTFLFTVLLLKTKTQKFQLIGGGVVLLGLSVVGVGNYLLGVKSSTEQEQTLIGYGLIVLALFGNGIHFVYQEHILRKYTVHPLELIGMEGILGIIFSIVLIPVLGEIPCQFGKDACVYNNSGEAVMEDISSYISQVTNNTPILLGVILVLVSMGTYNSLGAVIAKQMNSVTRAICDVTRTVLVWLIGVVVTVSAGSVSAIYKWQSVQVWQLCVQIVGFVILIIGNLIYYGIIVLKKQTLIDSLIEETSIDQIPNQ